ncbi:MAG: tetraacyldisaccharide 4'-kinase [Hyphomicrobiales bacterium]|nr:tetraacyldisaccharide 4'-kinase [Hyphomicrobiales bacterium]
MREPPFWWRPGSAAGALLAPLGALYGAVAGRRMRRLGARAAVPVVCIGNLTVGGAGKTPAALAVARLLAADGHAPVFLSRGYGGRLAGPVHVEASRHRAAEVGDEALLLARAAPTVVAHDRVRGAEAAVAAGASVIVMDDGFQNPSLVKDCSVLLVDARRGIGNGRVIPAGPLRAPLARQLECAQGLIVVGATADIAVAAAARARAIPVFRARLLPHPEALASLRGNRLLAYAGIGDPEKFFASLCEAGVAPTVTRSFDDHHRFGAREVRALCGEAEREGLVLVTTEKDLARMQGDAVAAPLRARSRAVPVSLAIEDEEGLRKLLRERLRRAG